MNHAAPFRRIRRLVASFGLLLVLCLSYEARGDSHEDGTSDEALSPGIKLRIESCGYSRPSGRIDDDDSSGDDDSSDDDDSSP